MRNFLTVDTNSDEEPRTEEKWQTSMGDRRALNNTCNQFRTETRTHVT
jgi:hypothetical protein